MPTVDYSNPFSSYDPSQFGVGKTGMEMFMADQKQQMAKPFVDMARQDQQMQLQEKQQKLQEFMSPQAQGARMSGFGADTAKNQLTMDVSPSLAKKQIDDNLRSIEASGDLTKAKIKEAQQYVNDHNQPHLNDFSRGLAGLARQWDKQIPSDAPDAFRHNIQKPQYTAFVNDWKLKHPGQELAEHLREYAIGGDGDTTTQAAIAQYTDTLQQKAQLELQLKAMEGASHVRGAEVAAEASKYGHDVTARQSGANAALAYGNRQEQVLEKKAGHINDAVKNVINSVPYMKEKDENKRKQMRQEARDEASSTYDSLAGAQVASAPGQPQATNAGRPIPTESVLSPPAAPPALPQNYKAPPGRVVVKDSRGRHFTIPQSQLQDALNSKEYTQVK